MTNESKKSQYDGFKDILFLMDYLVDNVIGEIPLVGELIDAAHSVVNLKGVEDKKTIEE